MWIKHEECTGIALGANKVRKLEFHFGGAQACGAGTTLVIGAVQPNLMRIAVAGGRHVRDGGAHPARRAGVYSCRALPTGGRTSGRQAANRVWSSLGWLVDAVNRRQAPTDAAGLVERLAGNAHAKRRHVREVRQALLARLVLLAEDDFLLGTVLGAPDADPPFQRASRAGVQVRMAAHHLPEHADRADAGAGLQDRH